MPTHTNTHIFRCANIPTGNLSNHIDAVFTPKSAEVGDDCCYNDLLKKGTRNVGSVCGVKLSAHTTPLFLDEYKAKSSVPQFQYDHCGQDAACWTREDTAKRRTYHYEFYRDGQRQLLPVAGIDFFDHNENRERHQADHQLRHFSLRQQSANVHQKL